MTEQLPISIKISQELIDQIINIRSVANKLEAQLNFQTLAANWYGDEDKILTITLYLDGIEGFIKTTSALNNKPLEILADDVFSYINNITNTLDCYIAVTPSELELITQQPKLLINYLPIKLTKVMNLIAHNLNLLKI